MGQQRGTGSRPYAFAVGGFSGPHTAKSFIQARRLFDWMAHEDEVEEGAVANPDVAPWRLDQVHKRNRGPLTTWRGPTTGADSSTGSPQGRSEGRERFGSRFPSNHHLLAALLALLFIPLSSLLGLSRPMVDMGGGLFMEVWAANLWGSLLFAAGTAGTFLLVWAICSWAARNLQDRAQMGVVLALVPLALFATWAVYATSWSFTGVSLDDSAFGFLYFASVWDGNWNFVWEWGLPGILAMAVSMPAAATLVAKSPASSPATVPA